MKTTDTRVAVKRSVGPVAEENLAKPFDIFSNRSGATAVSSTKVIGFRDPGRDNKSGKAVFGYSRCVALIGISGEVDLFELVSRDRIAEIRERAIDLAGIVRQIFDDEYCFRGANEEIEVLAIFGTTLAKSSTSSSINSTAEGLVARMDTNDFMASATDLNSIRAIPRCGESGTIDRVASVTVASVPSLPTISLDRLKSAGGSIASRLYPLTRRKTFGNRL